MRAYPLLFVILAACEPWPDLARAPTDRSGGYPALAPLGELLPAAEVERDEEAEAALTARAEALRERAAALRRPAIDPEARAELEAAAERYR